MAHGGVRIGQTTRPRYLGLAFILVYAVLTLGSDGQVLGALLVNPSDVGTVGANFERVGPPGAVTVRDLTPDSALRTAGVRAGDRLVLDHPWDDLRIVKAGERFGFVDVTRDPAHRRTVVAASAPRLSAVDTFYQALTPIGNIVMMLIGGLIAWRGRGDSVALCLGTAFVLIGPVPPFYWPIPSSHVPAWDLAVFAAIAAIPWFFLRFAMDYYARHTAPLRRWESRAFWALVALQGLLAGAEMVDTLWDLRLPGMDQIRPADFYLNAAALFIPAWYLARGWLRGAPDVRARYAVMLIALPLCFFPQAIYVLAGVSQFFKFDLRSPAIIAAALGFIVGPALFAYAMFRHKVLDLGFALNRALVYGVISAVLLSAFGLTEWAVDHFVPIQGREKNALIDAAIALAVFLAFHRVRDAVEHGVEALFFRRWRENETALRRFTAEAAYVTQPAALRSTFTIELERFCNAPCALYQRDARSRYRRANGAESMPAHIDPDDPALVALRSRNTAVEIDDTASTLDAALALPMAHRHDLEGFALIARKPDNERYRPDEIQALATAAHQVGLDLHALEIERLQQESEDLKRANESLAAQLQLAKDLAR